MSTTEPGHNGEPLARIDETAVAETPLGTVKGPVTDIRVSADIGAGYEYVIDETHVVDDDALL